MSVLFIINPISGKMAGKRRMVSRLKGQHVEFTACSGHAVSLAHNALEDIVVAVGGDGTVNEVARGLIGTGKTLGIVPCGSGNGLARCLGITASNALNVISKGKRQSLDWGTINSHPFFSVCGVGLDAVVSEEFAKAGTRGLSTYIAEALKVYRHFRTTGYELTVDGISRTIVASMITIGNSNQWGNNAKITPRALTNDGMLDIISIGPFRAADIPILVTKLMNGTIDQSPLTLSMRGKEIRILREEDGPAHFDGDFFHAGKELDIRISDQPLSILVP